MAARTDISFSSGDGTCTGWLFEPEAPSGSVPCVVMAHGFGACKEGRLDAFAERFAAAGFAALVFDYRHFGTSTGEPRQLVDIKRQHADWRAAIAHARGLEGIDPSRICLWGSSFSGGHVVWVAAEDPRIAAVVSQVPHASGPKTMAATGVKRNAQMGLAGMKDEVASLRGGSHRIPLVAPPGEVAVMNSDDAHIAYPGMYPPGFRFQNDVPARVLLRIGLYSPLRKAAHVRCPLLVLVGERDTITPGAPAKAMAGKAPRGELRTYDGTHFDIYSGPGFEWAAEEEVAHLRRSLGL